MSTVTKKLIRETIFASDSKWRICETGAGCPVATSLLSIEGASSVVYDTHVPYGKDAQSDAGYDTTERSVSARLVKSIMERKIQNVNCNAVYVSTFQVGLDVCTHGWIGIANGNVARIYHITLGKGIDRGSAIRAIGDIGIILMARSCGAEILESLPIDNVMDMNGTIMWEELLDAGNNFASILSASHVWDHADPAVVQANIDVERVESLRDNDDLVVMPGSFNPLHDGHMEMINQTTDWILKNKNHEASKTPIFSITLNNFDPDKNPVWDDVLDRVTSLIPKGKVMVTNSYKMADLIHMSHRTGASLHVPVGWDTFMRMEDELFTEEKYRCITWHIFDRDHAIANHRASGTENAKQVIRNLDNNSNVVLHEEREHMTLSSTEIRNGKT